MADLVDDIVSLVEYITEAALVDPVSTLLVAAGSLVLAGSVLVAVWLMLAAAADGLRSLAA